MARLSLAKAALAGSVLAAVAVVGVYAMEAGEPFECSRSVVFVGVRGSGQGTVPGPGDNWYGADGMGDQISAVFATFKGSNSDVLPIALGYPAEDVLGGAFGVTYSESVDNGGYFLEQLFDRLWQCSSSQKIVLAGYSQGAHVIKHGLARYRDSNLARYQDIAGRVQAVVLVGDPKWHGSERNYRIGNADPEDHGTLGSQMILSEVRRATLSVCNDGDMVCNTSVVASNLFNLNFIQR